MPCIVLCLGLCEEGVEAVGVEVALDLRRQRSFEPFGGGLIADEQLAHMVDDAEEALHAATLNAAAAMGLQHELGSLTVGKRASLIITRPVPSLAYLPYAFGQDHIDTVIIDGRTVRAGEAAA